MPRRLALLLALSGAAALCGEVVWMRRLALSTGSTGLALTLTLSGYMAGLGVGGLAAARWPWRRALRGYGMLELASAVWLLAFPALVDGVTPLLHGARLVSSATAALLVLPAGLLHGATLPAVSDALHQRAEVGRLYAANTAGAVLGVLLGTFFLLPAAGLRGTECIAAAGAAGAGLMALGLPPAEPSADTVARVRTPLAYGALFAAAIAGFAALGLEVAWARLAALLLGSSVYASAVVLAVFLGGIAAGAAWGRRLGAPALGPALLAMGLLAALGTLSWRVLPHAQALAWVTLGEPGKLMSGAALLGLAMAGAPVASGVAFTAAVDAAGGAPTEASGRVLAANTLGSVLGSASTGLLLVPNLGLQPAALVLGGLSALAGALHTGGRRAVLGLSGFCGLVMLTPRWDPALYAVGLGLRVAEFADLSPRAVERFAHEGWRLRYAAEGRTASIAVGESERTGNLWLSINGKVDASTGDDMPTQELSAQLPVAIHRARRPDHAPSVAVVGLASGVTAGAALQAGAARVDVIELEPRVVEAARYFEGVNRGVLDDPCATILVDDARAVLSRPGPPWDIIVSEPSNPWITGVSNLFTEEYWALARARLAPGGVFVQWVQLYALPPEAFRSLIRTFQGVFPEAWLFESIPGSDALLIAIHQPDASLPPAHRLPIAPTLGPPGLRRLARRARLNTDDMPWIEFEAPRWLHRQTGQVNTKLIHAARK